MKIIRFIILTLAAAPAFAQVSVNVVNVMTNDLVYNSATNRIYVTIPSANGSNGNSIGIINPDTHVLESTVAFGSEPSVMAITDDGQFLYAGFSNASIYRKFNISTNTAGQTFPLGADSFLGPYYADDIETIPGQPNSVVIARRYTGVSPRFAAVAIYDNGIARPTISDWYGAGEISNNIELKDATTAYGYGSETTAYSFNKLTIDTNGISLLSGTGMPQVGWSNNVGDFAYANDKCYFRNGVVVDVSFSTPFVLGNFSNVFGPVAVDAPNSLACFAHSESGVISFRRFNTESFLLYDQVAIPQATGTPKKAISLGNGRYAFNTENKVVILNDPSLAVSSKEQVTVKVYPNPTNDYAQVSGIAVDDIEQAVVLDITGKIVENQLPEDAKFNLSALAKGVYMIKITDRSKRVHTQKIVKK